MERFAHIAAQWEAEAATYDNGFDHTIGSDAERLAWDRILGLLDGGGRGLRVLDLGCGTGFLSLELAARGHEVTGMDAAAGMVERARTKASERGFVATFEVGDAESPHVDGLFDLVVSRHLFWALDDRPAVLERWLQLVRPGGRLAIIDGHWQPGDDESLAMDDVAALVRSAAPGIEVWTDSLEDLRSALARRAAEIGLVRPSFEYYLVMGRLEE